MGEKDRNRNNSLFVFLLSVSVIVMVFFQLQTIEYQMAAFGIDDSFYYLKIANNVTSGRGLTYDGHTMTNGFHPLWEGICILAAFLTGPEPASLYKVLLIFQGILVLFCIILLKKISQHLMISSWGMLVMYTILFFTRLDLWFSVMESSLLMYSLLLLLALSLKKNLLDSRRKKDNILLGFLLSVMFLSRLDTIFIVITLLIFQASRSLWAGRWPFTTLPVLRTGLTFTLISSPYLLMNWFLFGNIVPVSGAKKVALTDNLIKTVSNFILNITTTIQEKTHLPIPILFAILVLFILLTGWVLKQKRTRILLRHLLKNPVIPAILIGTIVRAFTLLILMEEYPYVPWYWVPEVIGLILLAGILMSIISDVFFPDGFKRSRVVFPAAVIMVLLGFTYIYYDSQKFQAWKRIEYNFAIWSANNTSSQSLFAMYDSGVFAYFSTRDVIPTNGLATDFDTMDQLRKGRLKDVLHDFEVDYYVTHIRADVDIPSELIIHASPVIPNGIYKGKKLTILNWKEHPTECETYIKRI